MWAGLNDGHVRIFDTTNYRLLEEFKAHCAAVTNMVVANMPTHDDQYEHHMHVVISCSADWTIGKWDPFTFQCLGRLQGHSNAVRCIAPSHSGEYLVSGGDDGALRMWSLISNREATAATLAISTGTQSETLSTKMHNRSSRSPFSSANKESGGGAPSDVSDGPRFSTGWPLLHMHQPGAAVTCVCIVRDEFIVSGGADGGVNIVAFDATGTWLRELERRPCAVTSILHEDVNSRLWIAGVDGVISLYKDEFPSVLPLTSLYDHSGIYVMSLCTMQRGNLFRCLALDDEGHLTKMVEVDCSSSAPETDLGKVSSNEVSLTEHIDHDRDLIVKSYHQLQKLRRELRAVEEYEVRRKKNLTIKLGDDFQTKQYFLYRAAKWILRQKFRNITALRADWMQRSSDSRLVARRYACWVLWFRERRNEKRKQTLVYTMRTASVHKIKVNIAFALSQAARQRAGLKDESVSFGLADGVGQGPASFLVLQVGALRHRLPAGKGAAQCRPLHFTIHRRPDMPALLAAACETRQRSGGEGAAIPCS